jgi:uncharacterized protein (TIGR02466 family)
MRKPKRARRNTHQNRNIAQNNSNEIRLETFLYFPTMISIAEIPEYLNVAKIVSNELLTKDECCKVDEFYPVKMSEHLFADERLFGLRDTILDLSWNILDQQGYDMQYFRVILTAMWTQQHHKYSSMEYHTHSGDQLVGFYFLKTPKGGSRPVFYDPRPAKVITDLPQKENAEINASTNIINFTPEPGKVFITNSFLPHSFTKNTSDEPTEFIHFNIKVIPYNPQNNDVEIV